MITRPQATEKPFVDLMRTAITGLDSASPSERIEATMAYQDAVGAWGANLNLRTEINRQKLLLALCLQGQSLMQADSYLENTAHLYASAYGLQEVSR